MLENGSDLPINERQKIRRYSTRSIKEIMWYLCKCAIIGMLYTHFSGIINNNNNRPPACPSTSFLGQETRYQGMMALYKKIYILSK